MFQTLLGAILAIATTIAVEYLRRPKLYLFLAASIDMAYTAGTAPATSARYLLISCINRPLPWFARWMSRSAALQCRGTITYHHLDGQNIFGRVMPIRWSGTSEPVPLILLSSTPGRIIDPNRMGIDSRIDIHPGDTGHADSAVRFDNEQECYERCEGIFRLINDVEQKDFRLEPSQPEDRRKIKLSIR
jgi:hypothetical protein